MTDGTPVIELLIPLELPSQNVTDRMHWSKRHKIGKQWETWLRYSMRAGGMDNARGKRHVHIMAYRTQRIKDESNMHGGAKYAVDALVRCGLLMDDSDKLATFEYHQATCKDSPTKKPCTRITITETLE